MKLLIIFNLVLFSYIAAGNDQTNKWSFAAFVDGKEMGSHTFVLTGSSEDRELKSEAQFKVKFLFITAYQYEQILHEKWNGHCLTSLDSKTVENKKATNTSGHLEGKNFVLETKKPKETLPECVMTFAYWDSKILSQTQLLNSQTGELINVKISPLGKEAIQVRGQKMETEHYKIEAQKMEIDIWYSVAVSTEDKVWVALKSKTPDGHIVTYQLR